MRSTHLHAVTCETWLGDVHTTNPTKYTRTASHQWCNLRCKGTIIVWNERVQVKKTFRSPRINIFFVSTRVYVSKYTPVAISHIWYRRVFSTDLPKTIKILNFEFILAPRENRPLMATSLSCLPKVGDPQGSGTPQVSHKYIIHFYHIWKKELLHVSQCMKTIRIVYLVKYVE
jgi:hypothetical protein